MRRDATVSAAVAAALALATTAAAAAVPQPPIDGVVVEDVTQPYSIDLVGLSFEGGPFFFEDAIPGDRAIDGDPRARQDIRLLLPYHDVGGGAFADLRLHMASARAFSAFWTVVEDGGGALSDGVIVLDTDATAYGLTGTYRLSDSQDLLQGNCSAVSELYRTFAPAVPEPRTYALMLCGLGALAFIGRWGRRSRSNV
jgi:hypothetical protein